MYVYVCVCVYGSSHRYAYNWLIWSRQFLTKTLLKWSNDLKYVKLTVKNNQQGEGGYAVQNDVQYKTCE